MRQADDLETLDIAAIILQETFGLHPNSASDLLLGKRPNAAGWQQAQAQSALRTARKIQKFLHKGRADAELNSMLKEIKDHLRPDVGGTERPVDNG